MLNIYYWENLTFSKLVGINFFGKKIRRNALALKSKKGTKYIRVNVYFDIIVFSCLSSTKLYLRFLLICFAREIKSFYQGFFGNEIDFRDIMNVSLRILAKKQIFKKLGHGLVDKKALITTTLISSSHSKTLVPFCLQKKRFENAFLTLIVNYCKIVQKNKLNHEK